LKSNQKENSSSTSATCVSAHEPLPKEKLIPLVDDIIKGFSATEGALIPVLQSIQNLCGYLPNYALRHVSERLKIPYSEVAGVVSFYSYFSTVPRGKNVVRVCLGTACYVRGGKEVLEHCKKALGINVGGTTEDRQFSLEVGRCFGACGLAPVVMVNDDVHQRVKSSKIKELLSQYAPTAGSKREEKI
jgi:NADH:ubiquinone oxidoreductase subunit E